MFYMLPSHDGMYQSLENCQEKLNVLICKNVSDANISVNNNVFNVV